MAMRPDPLDELQAFLQGQGQAPEAVAPSVHHNSELDFVSEPVVSPLQAASPYPPGHEPKPVSDGPGGLSAGPTQKPSLLSKVKGWFKRAEALEQPQHSLNWRGYGTPGKGLYYNDTGQVFTWPVSGPDRVPHHLDMHQEFRPDLRIKEQDFLRAGHVPFNISPLGRIDNSWEPDGVIHPNAIAGINQADSRLQVGDVNNEGGFGHARNILDSLDHYGMAWPNTLYHVSPASNRDSIQGEGLRAHEPDFPMANPTAWGQGIRGNYAFDTPHDAHAYATYRSGGTGQPHDVWEIGPAHGLPVEQDPEPWVMNEPYHPDEVQPDDFLTPGEMGGDDLQGEWYWMRDKPDHMSDEDFEREPSTVGSSPIRWRIPDHVRPELLRHHQTVEPEEYDALPENWAGGRDHPAVETWAPEAVSQVQFNDPGEFQQYYQRFAPKQASDDELHYSLEIPEDIKHRIKAWVDDQNWPEDTDFEDPDDYHITLLYAKDGHDEHRDADWLYETDGYDVKVVGIDEFGDEAKKAVVLRIKCDELLDHANDLLDAAENRGLDVSRFPGGYKPHLTVAYAFGKPPYARYPKLKFKTGPSATSEPREGSIQHSACGCIVPCTCPDKENTTGGWLRSGAHSDDPYMCRTCLKPTLAEPRPLQGDWRWLQTCTNCGRSTSISPTHPVVQAIKNAQPQYPALLDEVAEPRPLGEWLASETPQAHYHPYTGLPCTWSTAFEHPQLFNETNPHQLEPRNPANRSMLPAYDYSPANPDARTAAHGLGPCPNCGGDITTNNSYNPGAQEPYACSNCGKLFTDSQARMTMPPGPNCPKCNTEMQWRDSSSLGGLWPKGAWECLNQRCWHMIPPGGLAPDTVPNEMTNDWRPEGWDDETEHPLGPHTGSRVAMPADPNWWQEWSKRGPLYHTTLESNLPSILSEGLRPASDLGNARYDNWFTPRPGHTYLTGDIERAHDHAKNAPGADDGNHVMLAIDPSHLDPQHINPDEDWMMDHNTLPDNEYEQIVQHAAPDWQIGQGLTNAWPEGLGQTAERVGLGDDPAHTQHGIEDMNSIAYRGTIPPEAIRQLHYDPEREDYFDDPASHVASTRQSAVRSWEKGRWGHGLLDSNDEVHVWNSEPERDDQIASLLDENPQARFLVNPAGGFLLQGGRKDRDGVMDYISQAHPDLWPMPQLQAGPGGLEDMGDGDQVL